MPADTGMTTAQFVSYIIFSLISLPVIWIRPYRLEKFFRFVCSVTFVFFLVLLIWALATMGPSGFGDTITSGSALPNTGGPDSIGVNVPGNALAGGVDLAATFPKYLNIRRGAYMTAIFSVFVDPWRLVNTATTFLTVLSSYCVLLAPMTA
ncbi:Uridine permease [Colletotrichum shisoi]|uniref:Uridine permease n=1 Tax=Colletotrichum shisoi TaxID=2078593 RepID=A0A5Q4BAZ8_9PEZI|nr:Uridine permease [Colletotrichum shisoi]